VNGLNKWRGTWGCKARQCGAPDGREIFLFRADMSHQSYRNAIQLSSGYLQIAYEKKIERNRKILVSKLSGISGRRVRFDLHRVGRHRFRLGPLPLAFLRTKRVS